METKTNLQESNTDYVKQDWYTPDLEVHPIIETTEAGGPGTTDGGIFS